MESYETEEQSNIVQHHEWRFERNCSGGMTRWLSDTVINTSSREETEAYLARSTENIYRDPNPTIIPRELPESAVTQEQRIRVQFFRPPPLPPPEPTIIKEVRDTQPPAPLPIVICEYPRPPPSPPQLILREEPPTPPLRTPGKTIIKRIPAVPVPPRSVIIKRFPTPAERPRDILIERWLPYETQPEMPPVIERAPPAPHYPRPFNTIVVYSGAEARTVRKFERLGATQEDPSAYRARYGASLLSSAALLQEARNAGVHEDLTIVGEGTIPSYPYPPIVPRPDPSGSTIGPGYSIEDIINSTEY